MKRATFSHPKLLALSQALKINRREAIGLLSLLWDFAGQYASAGDIGKFTNEAIAIGVDWPSETADELVKRLVQTNWLDETDIKNGRLLIHDWEDHCEQWVIKKNQRAGIIFVHPICPSNLSIHSVPPLTPPALPCLAMPLPISPADAGGDTDHPSLIDIAPHPPEKPKPPPAIERIYRAYPRKENPKAAHKAIAAALKDIAAARFPPPDCPQWPPDDPGAWLEARTASYAAAVKLWPASDLRFVPHPASWFNSGAYSSDPATWKKESKNGTDENISRVHAAPGKYDRFTNAAILARQAEEEAQRRKPPVVAGGGIGGGSNP